MELYGLPNTANAFTAASSACGSMRTRAPLGSSAPARLVRLLRARLVA
jgi:hypothetical protein